MIRFLLAFLSWSGAFFRSRHDLGLELEPLPEPPDWASATSRAEVLFGIRANPYLTAAGLAEFT
ncbi:MAG TPA: hypothetical protein VIX19_10335, partial [Terriglobales bacterium]